MSSPIQREDIAIVGMAGLFAGSPDVGAFWENILSKTCCISEHPDPAAVRYLDPDSAAFERVYNLRGGYLGSLAEFDPLPFGIVPDEVRGGDPDQFLALRLADAALTDAGLRKDSLPGERTEVILGHGNYFNAGMVGWTQLGLGLDQVMSVLQRLVPGLIDAERQRIRADLKRSLPEMNAHTPSTVVPNIVAGRVANRLNLMGANYIIDAACASTLLALDHAVKDLALGRCDCVITGGIQTSLCPLELMLFSALGALSHGAHPRPFDRQADGTLLGEGGGFFVLKRRSDAERDGHRIYALIKGVGAASDGRAQGVMAPRMEGEALAIRRAYEISGVDPRTVELIEAHGTGIPLGDATEIRALVSVFGAREGVAPTCGIGSVKSVVGHCRPASGAAGLLKTVLALHHRILPPTLHCEEPDPGLGLEQTPFYVNTEPRPWIHGRGTPRRAGVSSMGFGGINAHCVLEEYVG